MKAVTMSKDEESHNSSKAESDHESDELCQMIKNIENFDTGLKIPGVTVFPERQEEPKMLESFRLMNDKLERSYIKLPTDLLVYLNNIMEANTNCQFENRINFYDKKLVAQKITDEFCPEAIKYRWLYACSCMGINDIEPELTVAIECLFLAFRECKITLKDMEPIVTMIIK